MWNPSHSHVLDAVLLYAFSSAALLKKGRSTVVLAIALFPSWFICQYVSHRSPSRTVCIKISGNNQLARRILAISQELKTVTLNKWWKPFYIFKIHRKYQMNATLFQWKALLITLTLLNPSSNISRSATNSMYCFIKVQFMPISFTGRASVKNSCRYEEGRLVQASAYKHFVI